MNTVVPLKASSPRPLRRGERTYPPAMAGTLSDRESGVRQRFRRALLKWYDANKRELPWRLNRDPYRVWVSEIMLQQTRVAAVIGYYERFLERFPTVQDLAAAHLDSVLAAWSGLGYYRRARALLAAAKVIVWERRGVFPISAEEWRRLPGVGRYTSSAIASIALNEPVPVVDGNVERVLSRLMSKPLSGEDLWKSAAELVSSSRPGDFNQAMMELGATICVPGDPQCLICPVRYMCATRGALPATGRGERRKAEISYALNRRKGAILLTRRSAKASLMAGMWELPEIEAPGDASGGMLTLRHSITVTDYLVHVFPDRDLKTQKGRWVPQSCLPNLPLTGLTRKILRTVGVIQ